MGGVNSVFGINVAASHDRTAGATGNSYYGGRFLINGPASASSATNLAYYGIYGEANGASSGEVSSVYGVYAKATGPSSVIGIFSEVSGGTQNFAGIFMGGNVGVGTQTPTSKLHVVGDAQITGALTVGSCTGCTSDERIKTNIVNITNALSVIKTLRPVAYQRTDQDLYCPQLRNRLN